MSTRPQGGAPEHTSKQKVSEASQLEFLAPKLISPGPLPMIGVGFFG